MSRLFVYGSLMKGLGNHRTLEGATFDGEATTAPLFTMISMGGFPAILADGRTAIRGELYDVDEYVLARCDTLEGHPNFYRRTTIALANGERCEAYVLPPGRDNFRCSDVDDGDWRAELARRGRL